MDKVERLSFDDTRVRYLWRLYGYAASQRKSVPDNTTHMRYHRDKQTQHVKFSHNRLAPHAVVHQRLAVWCMTHSVY